MSDIKVSVIIPVYNVERYIEMCLSSLVEQTLEDIELIIINDGSPDNSQAIIDRYKEQYPAKIVSVIRENGGQATARNEGIEIARGEYLAFVDSDDYVEVTMMEKLYSRAKETGADIVACGFRYVYENGSFVERQVATRVEPGDNIYESKTMLAHASAFMWNKLWRRSLFMDTGIRFPDQKMEDVAISYNLLSNARKVAFVEEPLYNYRSTRKGSTSNTLNKATFDIFPACDSFLRYFRQKGIYDEFADELEYRCITHVTLRFLMIANVMDADAVNSYVDAAFDYLDSNFPDWRENKYYKADRENSTNKDVNPAFFEARIDREKLKDYYRRKRRKKRLNKLKFWK